MPNVWNSGTGTQTRSADVYPQVSPTKNALLRRLWWVRVAPLGWPVVPDVYWMLIGSYGDSVACRASRCLVVSACDPAARPSPARRSARRVQARGSPGATSSIIAAWSTPFTERAATSSRTPDWFST